MAIWAAFYLELWKRYSATIVHRWGTTDFSRVSEHARPAYLARVRSKKKQAKIKTNPVTWQQEPTLSLKFKLPNYLLSYSIIILYVIYLNYIKFNANLHKIFILLKPRYYYQLLLSWHL